jgi:hypothetical protein
VLPTGLDPRAVNVTSTVALVPEQLAAGWVERKFSSSAPALSLRWLAGLAFASGVLGALPLLTTPVSVFSRMGPSGALCHTAVRVGQLPPYAADPARRVLADVAWEHGCC